MKDMVIDMTFVGFLKGHPGIYSVASVIYHILGLDDQAQVFNQKVIDTFNQVDKTTTVGLDYGLAGLLYCADFLQDYYGKEIVPRDLVVKVATLAMEIGI